MRIFSVIEIDNQQLPLENCASFDSDNANVMVARKKGVFGYLKRKKPDYAFIRLHIAAMNAENVIHVAVVAVKLVDFFLLYEQNFAGFLTHPKEFMLLPPNSSKYEVKEKFAILNVRSID